MPTYLRYVLQKACSMEPKDQHQYAHWERLNNWTLILTVYLNTLRRHRSVLVVLQLTITLCNQFLLSFSHMRPPPGWSWNVGFQHCQFRHNSSGFYFVLLKCSPASWIQVCFWNFMWWLIRREWLFEISRCHLQDKCSRKIRDKRIKIFFIVSICVCRHRLFSLKLDHHWIHSNEWGSRMQKI